MEDEQSDKIEHRAMSKFLTFENLSPSDIHQRMQKVYGQAVLMQQSKIGSRIQERSHLLEDQRSPMPCSATSDQNGEQVSKIV